MGATYNLKDTKTYESVKNEFIEEINTMNAFNKEGFPLNDESELLTIDDLWEYYGRYFDRSQTGLVIQLFNEIIDYYKNRIVNKKEEPKELPAERVKEIIEEARQDFLDAYECGQLNENCLDKEVLRESGYTEQEIKLYIATFEGLMYS